MFLRECRGIISRPSLVWKQDSRLNLLYLIPVNQRRTSFSGIQNVELLERLKYKESGCVGAPDRTEMLPYLEPKASKNIKRCFSQLRATGIRYLTPLTFRDQFWLHDRSRNQRLKRPMNHTKTRALVVKAEI